jgi:hypothetical protein
MSTKDQNHSADARAIVRLSLLGCPDVGVNDLTYTLLTVLSCEIEGPSAPPAPSAPSQHSSQITPNTAHCLDGKPPSIYAQPPKPPIRSVSAMFPIQPTTNR